MATKNIVPRAAGEGLLGTIAKPWAKVITADYKYMSTIESDFQAANISGLGGGPRSTGTFNTAGTVDINHPGVYIVKSSTTADSGYFLSGNAVTMMLLGGGEIFEFVFTIEATTGTTARFGYHTALAVTAPIDGAYLQIVGTTLAGVARSNNSETLTADTVTITQGVWYRVKIVLNSDATLATFTLFTCADGLPVTWVNNTVATNIPTGAGRFVAPTLTVTNSAANDAKNLSSYDWVQWQGTRVLIR